LKSRIAAVLALAASAGAASGQGHPLAPVVLQLPGGTRALAMGNTDIGGRDDDVLFYNAAQLAIARGTSLSAEWYTHANTLTTFSTTLPFASGGLGVGIQSLQYSAAGAAPATVSALATSGAVPGSGFVLAAGYAQRLFGTRVGVITKLVDDELGSYRDMRSAFDAGVARDMLQGTFGLTVQNLGEAMRTPVGRVPMPTRTTLGYQAGGLAVGPLDLAAAGALTVTRGRSVGGGLGAELSYGWIDGYTVSVRGGARLPSEGTQGHLTTGIGLAADRLTLEYALDAGRMGQTAHRVGLRIR
jgi:hypothetical protein